MEQKVPIPVESLKQHFLRMHADDDLLFKEEFKVSVILRLFLHQLGGFRYLLEIVL